MTAIDLTPMYPYQRRMLEAIAPRRGAPFPPYGTGKSYISLAAAERRMHSVRNEFGCMALVLCRPRNMITWQIEIAKRAPHAQLLCGLDGLNELLQEGDSPDFTGGILLMPHSQIHPALQGLESFTACYRPAAIIMDESTSIKNPKAKITKAAMQLSRRLSPSCLRMILSGKPMPEAPFEIWSQYEFCYPRRNPLGQTYYTFLNRWFIKAGHDWALRLDRRDEFYQVVGRHCLEFDLRDLEEWRKVVGVNDARYLIETYEESSEQRNLLDYMYENWALPRTLEILDTEDEYDDCDQGVIGDVGDIEFNYTMSLQSKARQIASGFYYTPEGDVVELRHNPKLALLGGLVEDLIREKPNRAIVVWQLYKAERPQLLDLFERIGVHAVLGPSPEALAQFATEAAQVIIMPATSTQGFNELVRADTNIFYSSPYSTELREQAESRLVRIGQTSEVVNHIDLCSPRLIDRDIITALQTKSLSTARLKAIFNKYASKPRLKETAR